MTDPVFDTATTSLHRTARFGFVPWLARMLDGGPLRGETPELPVGDEKALTDETVAAISDIANRASWRFLARTCGWRRLDAVSPGNPDAHSIRRLWDDRAALPSLEFSTATPALLLTVFNATRKGGKIGEATLPDCTRHNGDLIIHHLVFRRLCEAPQSLGLDPNFLWPAWYANPLNALFHVTSYGFSVTEATRWDAVTAPGIAAYFPWIGLQLIQNTRQKDVLSWTSGKKNIQRLRAMTLLLTDLALEAERAGRIDLLGFLLRHFAEVLKASEQDFAAFERATNGFTQRERQEMAQPWADYLSFVEPLSRTSRECSEIHPIERTGPQNCFLAQWEAANFTETVECLRDFRQRVRPTFS